MQAVKAIVRYPFSRLDNEVFQRIEDRRATLESDSSLIEFIDHGAGSGRPGTRTVSQLTGASKNAFWGRLLYRVCVAIESNSSLELGACVGVSGSYIAAGSCSLTTIEGDPSLAAIAQRTFDENGVSARCHVGPFRDVLPSVLPDIGPIDFAFIDGHHDGDATLEYLAAIKPYLSDDAVVAFDDIYWSESMIRAWQSIRADAEAWIDLRQIGVITVGPTVN